MDSDGPTGAVRGLVSRSASNRKRNEDGATVAVEEEQPCWRLPEGVRRAVEIIVDQSY